MDHLSRPDGVRLPAALDLPAGPVRGGIVVLHGAEAGGRSYFLYRHLAEVLPPAGVAVLRYDRRPTPDGRDVPLATQAADALAALRALRSEIGDLPIGLWGFSQGAWAATVAAGQAPDEVAFLALVSWCGVTPARQMRFGTAEQLRRHGYGDDDPAELAAGVRCPALLLHGETDEWMPIDGSVTAWRRAGTGDTGFHRLTGCGHLPTTGGVEDPAAISPDYTRILLDQLDRWLPPRA